MNWLGGHWSDVLFVLAFIFTLIVPLIFGFKRMGSEMGEAIVIGFLTMAFTRIHLLSEFKGFGFLARTRRDMEEATKEAYAKIEGVQELACALTAVSMEALIGTGFGGGRGYSFCLRHRHDLHRILRDKLKVPASAADNACRIFDNHVEFMLGSGILHAIRDHSTLPKKELESVRQKLVSVTERTAAPTEDFERFINEKGLSEIPQVQEAMENLKFFRKSGEFHTSL